VCSVGGSFPAGDPVGGAAAQRLWELSAAYPNRMYCPVDHYVSGPEKELLLQATDFCMLPSRFEPCGLVDVEFAWVGGLRRSAQFTGMRLPSFVHTSYIIQQRSYMQAATSYGLQWRWSHNGADCACACVCLQNGSIIIGHDTGGLGKMPG
jgi:hypothetical protein